MPLITYSLRATGAIVLLPIIVTIFGLFGLFSLALGVGCVIRSIWDFVIDGEFDI